MEWRGRRESGNVEDRRGMKLAGGLGGAGFIVALIYFLISGDPSVLTQNTEESRSVQSTPAQTEEVSFVRVVLADTEDSWNKLFGEGGRSYQEPKLVLFDGEVQSACGRASATVGPFYCPRDQQVYIDLSFARDLKESYGAEGDFAMAYVIAHEIGHHVQNQLGLLSGGTNKADSVRTELQADCLAGVWAADTQQSKQVLEEGDLEEALGAAAAVGDDRLQKKAQGYVVPDSFTHGSSEQRMAAFQRGFKGAALSACVTERSETVTGR